MNGERKPEAKRKHYKTRLADLSPWPPCGYVNIAQMMAALGVKAPQTVYSYVAQGLISEPEPIGPNRVGWKVERARKDLDELPGKVRRSRTAETLTARRLAARETA
ncbi:MAG: hypothetical protein KJZ83_20820 [Burkholderiaceae bacterium]|nr:hypothetical protein [Burkholderiaceae bacterium]